MNNQKPTSRTNNPKGDLSVHSVFHTIQGEGPYQGHSAVFVRLNGCNLQCPKCDTEYTQEKTNYTVGELLSLVIQTTLLNKTKLVVITGGEPLNQNLNPFVKALLYYDYTVQIETNGTLYQDLPFDKITIVCSPKTGTVNEKLRPHISALKYVIDNSMSIVDGLPGKALGHPAHPKVQRPWEGFTGQIYVQPADEGQEEINKKNLEWAIRSSKQFGYILGIQIHKIIGEQ